MCKFVKLSPRDYARHNRQWQGIVPVSQFTRLGREFSFTSNEVDVELAFSVDENGHTRVHGRASVTGNVTCHRCSELVSTTINADIDAFVVESQQLAEELAQDFDVIELEEREVSVSELVEDDLMLSLPWRVICPNENCENDLLKKGDDRLAEKSSPGKRRPFANLRDLLDGD